jgi:hypothetical protein
MSMIGPFCVIVAEDVEALRLLQPVTPSLQSLRLTKYYSLVASQEQ